MIHSSIYFSRCEWGAGHRVRELFVAILAAEAGNPALTALATGGIYLGGGTAPRILAELQTPAFPDTLRPDGCLRELLSAMPVHAILETKAGRHGAAVSGMTVRDSD